MACAWPTMKATNHEITIFQSQTLEKISVLKGQNQAICDMVFTKNDQYPIFTKFFICMWWRYQMGFFGVNLYSRDSVLDVRGAHHFLSIEVYVKDLVLVCHAGQKPGVVWKSHNYYLIRRVILISWIRVGTLRSSVSPFVKTHSGSCKEKLWGISRSWCCETGPSGFCPGSRQYLILYSLQNNS